MRSHHMHPQELSNAFMGIALAERSREEAQAGPPGRACETFAWAKTLLQVGPAMTRDVLSF